MLQRAFQEGRAPKGVVAMTVRRMQKMMLAAARKVLKLPPLLVLVAAAMERRMRRCAQFLKQKQMSKYDCCSYST